MIRYMLQMPVSGHIISRKIIAVYEIKVPESIAGIRTAGIDETLNHNLPEHTELGKDKKLLRKSSQNRSDNRADIKKSPILSTK